MNKKYLLGGIVAVVIIGAVVLVELWPLMPWNQTNGPRGFPTFDNPPVIDTPNASTAFAGQNIRVDANVTDDNLVSNVILSWSNDSKVTWNNVTMAGTGTTNWTGTGYIPAQDIETTVFYQIYAEDNASQWTVNNNSGNAFSVYTGSRKALILNTDDKFYESSPNDNFNNGGDSNLDISQGHWSAQFDSSHTTAGWGLLSPGDGALQLYSTSAGPVNGNWSLSLNSNYPPVINYGYYNLSANVSVPAPFIGTGARIGLRWTNGGNEVRMDWGDNVSIAPGWMWLNCSGVCNNQTGQQITGVDLVLSINGSAPGAGISAYFDNIHLWHQISVNTTFPGGGIPAPDAEPAFPAQVLQVYWTLINHGYSDSNIFLMLYNNETPFVQINANEGIHNDVVGAAVDVANDSINATRLERELNSSIPGSFASGIQPNDQLIIYLCDHGATNVGGDGNATFCFATGGNITELEFDWLVNNITCWRKLIMVDCCFSGNFLQSDNVGPTWYSVPNAILVSAAANVASWYWKNTNSPDGWAGSWMFHPFWDALNQGQTVSAAFTSACIFQPKTPPPVTPVAKIQSPQIQDYLGIMGTWSFASFPKL